MPEQPAPQDSQHRQASKTLRKGNAQFPRFEQLPTEIRLQIWLTAVHQATVDRSIHVEVHPFLYVTEHSCFIDNGVFCGQHGSCSTVLKVRHRPSICMADGYFSSTTVVSSPEDAISSPALASLSLACRESRTAVLDLYPTVLKVFERRWDKSHPDIKSRLVRCRPETDTLVIYAVPDVSLTLNQSTEASWRHLNEARMAMFPNDEGQFSAFRAIVASFQHVALGFGPNDPEFEDDGNQEQAVDNVEPDNDSVTLLLFFESLKHLYFWVDPRCWPYPRWRDGARSNNFEDIESTMSGAMLDGAKKLQTESLEFLNGYNIGVKQQNAHSVANDAHWVPQPKLLKHIGYCLPGFDS